MLPHMKKMKIVERHSLDSKACKVARAGKGLTGKQLAASLRIPFQTWFAYEAGRRRCPQPVLRRAAKRLGVSQESLRSPCG